MRKLLGSLLLVLPLLLSAESTSEEIAADKALVKNEKAKLEAAKLQAAEARATIEAAQKRLAAAEKVIKKEEIALPAKDGGEIIFTTHAELGYVKTTGNTDTSSGSLDFMQKAEWGLNTVQLDIDYLYGEEDGVENNNKLIVLLDYDYKFAKHVSFDYLTGYKDDKFSGFDYQFFTGPGLKFHVLETDEHKLTIQGNAVYSRDVESDKYYLDPDFLVETEYPHDPVKGPYKDPKSGDVNEYGSFFTKGDYEWQITNNFKFIQMLAYRVDMGDRNTYFVNSKSGIESEINKMFSLGMNYKVTYVNEAPSDNEHTDTVFTVALIINY